MFERFFVRCSKCGTQHFISFFKQAHFVCSRCGHHTRLDSVARLKKLVDRGTFHEIDAGIGSLDPLAFPRYAEKIAQAEAETGLREAVVTGIGEIDGHRCALAVMDPRFIMASMGSVVGEKITRVIERAIGQSLPVVMVISSGGARMQEGILSLLQMAKTAGAVRRLHERELPLFTVLCDPTTGGVTASFAMLGDVTLAEPGALIGFAGPRVIQQTIGQTLPPGFQTAEFLLEHGMVDKVVPRKQLKPTLATLLAIHGKRGHSLPAPGADVVRQLRAVDEADGTPAIEIVRLARHPQRPTSMEWIRRLVTDFVELHGDRRFADDQAIVGGVGFFKGVPVTVIGHQKGRSVKENIKRHFGMAHPEGYRKAMRLMEQAERFHRPVITLIDTPGAYPGIGAEERGQAEAIATNLYRMSGLRTPIVAVITGEGGSGGALGLGVADHVFMLSNAVYSVISPEGCASILWKDAGRADQAARSLRLTAADLLRLDVIDGIVHEPAPGAHDHPEEVMHRLRKTLAASLHELLPLSPDVLVRRRYEKYRGIGVFTE